MHLISIRAKLGKLLPATERKLRPTCGPQHLGGRCAARTCRLDLFIFLYLFFKGDLAKTGSRIQNTTSFFLQSIQKRAQKISSCTFLCDKDT